MWSSGGSLVATPTCKTAVPGLKLAISLAYRGLPVLQWTWYFTLGCPLRGDRGEEKQSGLLLQQKQLKTKQKSVQKINLSVGGFFKMLISVKRSELCLCINFDSG
jgi:hypothetical protein